MRGWSGFVLLVVTGFVPVGSAAEEPWVRAVATTSIVADLVRQVGGPRVRVEALMGPGVDPHLYKATAGDVVRLQKADVIFYNGLHLEGRMGDVFTRVARQGGKVYAVAEALPEERLLLPGGSDGMEDPHVWFDPPLWAEGVAIVVEGLSAVDPGGAAEYAARGEAARHGILEAHAWAGATLAAVPAQRRVLVTSHDAFAYFGRAYDFRVIAIQGISTVTEAGLADVVAMIDFIRKERVPAIFVESSVSPATIRRVSRDAGVRIGGELFSDALGEPGDVRDCGGIPCDVGTWAGMFRHNVRMIAEALSAP